MPMVSNGEVVLIVTKYAHSLSEPNGVGYPLYSIAVSDLIIDNNIGNTGNNIAGIRTAGAGLPYTNTIYICWDPYNGRFVCITSDSDSIWRAHMSYDNGYSWQTMTQSKVGITIPNTSYPPTCISVGKNGFGKVMYIIGCARLLYSYDLIIWQSPPTFIGDNAFANQIANSSMNEVKYNGTLWLASSITTNNVNWQIISSYDGLLWKLNTAVASVTLNEPMGFRFAWNGQIWITTSCVYGLEYAIYSYDGLDWYRCIFMTPLVNATHYKTVAFNGSYFVFYPYRDSPADNTGATNGVYYVSYNGINIQKSIMKLNNAIFRYSMNTIPLYQSMPYIDNITLVTGPVVGMYNSPTGQSGSTGWTGWTGCASGGGTGPLGRFSSLTIARPTVIAVGVDVMNSSKGIYITTDGTTWSLVTSPATGGLSAIAHNGSLWVGCVTYKAGTTNQVFLWSKYGYKWNWANNLQQSIRVFASQTLGWDAINYIWYIVIYAETSGSSRLYTGSADGTTWTYFTNSKMISFFTLYGYGDLAFSGVWQFTIPATGEIRLFASCGYAAYPYFPLVSVVNLLDIGTPKAITSKRPDGPSTVIDETTTTMRFSPGYVDGMEIRTMATDGRVLIAALSWTGGTNWSNQPLLYYSVDGINWQNNYIFATNGEPGSLTNLRDTLYNNGLTQLQSQTGIGILVIAYLNGKWFILLQNSPSLMYSYDSLYWYPCTGDTLTYRPILSSIMYNGTVYMAIAYSQTAVPTQNSTLYYYMAANSIVWSPSTNELGNVIVGTTDGRHVFTSKDGIFWTTKITPMI